ncbi:MAG: YqgE/AlgH family protein [Pseudomonadota bacterium]
MKPEKAFPSLCGKLLIAMPGMGDSRFERSVIYICAHSEEGAMGFIVNRTMESPTIPEFLQQLDIVTDAEVDNIPGKLAAAEMHMGGPVEPGRGFVLHSSDFASSSTVEVRKNVCLTATLEILRAIATGKGPDNAILALGYSGWSSGQLEDEIGSNGWLTVDATDHILFECGNKEKYSKSLALLGVDESVLSSDAGHA